MTFCYDLLEVDKPQFGGIVFPLAAVQNAITSAHSDAFRKHDRMELCRYERWPESLEELPGAYIPDWMTTRLSDVSGRLLEVVGDIQELEVVNGTVKARGVMRSDLMWHLPLEGHIAIPYMEMRSDLQSGLKIVKSFRFTEVVLVYQAVTKLALRKFAERKSISGVDKPR